MARTERHKIHNREAVAEMPEWMKEKHCPHKKQYMAGKRIMPKNLTGKEKLPFLIDEVFLAYNSARLKEACQLFAHQMLDPDVTIGMSISGALTPAGLGCSSIIPLIKAGFVDWIVSTGANLYHDLHFALNYPVHSCSVQVDDTELRGSKLRMTPSIDVNETTGIVLAAKRAGGRSGVVLWGGGSPKNFTLQTEPQIQEVLRIKEFGQDFFIQVTDARPDTGGLSGATPGEAVRCGKVDPTKLPDAIVCYTDTTIAMPILTHYALATHKPRKLKRLYDHRDKMMKALTKEYFVHNKVKMIDGSDPVLD